MLEDAVNQWTDHLKGWDGWKFDHVKVEVVGYAVLDKDCLLDLQPDEVVYTDTTRLVVAGRYDFQRHGRFQRACNSAG